VAANDRMLALGGPLSSFPFCPALAAQHTGNPLDPGEEHRSHAEIVEDLRVDGSAPPPR
jgi:hypothetical protein